jgi:copper chaperone CopZ
MSWRPLRGSEEALVAVEGVEEVEVDLASKLVTLRGNGLDDLAVRFATTEAGYEAE